MGRDVTLQSLKEHRMLKKFACALAVMLIGSVALAETVRGIITSATSTEITITPFTGKGKEAKKGEEQKIKVHKDAKVHKAKGKKDKDDSSIDDLVAAIKKTDGKGVFATVEVEDKKATSITYRTFGRKKKVKKDDAE